MGFTEMLTVTYIQVKEEEETVLMQLYKQVHRKKNIALNENPCALKKFE